MAENGSVLVYEWAEGVPALQFLARATEPEAAWFVGALLQQCGRLDAAGVNKQEMTHPERHIVVAPGAAGLTLLDFERSTTAGSKPCNVTQVCQWLCCPQVTALLTTHGGQVDVTRARQLAGAYKKAADTQERASRLAQLAAVFTTANHPCCSADTIA